MRHLIGSSSVNEQASTSCQSAAQETINDILNEISRMSCQGKCICHCRLQGGGHFVSASVS